MYYEEKIINGILHCRYSPDDEFKPMSTEQITKRFEEKSRLLEAQVSKANGDTEEDFTKELSSLINRHSKENGSNTPDFILAHYLNKCLDTFDLITKRREKWYGRN
jgi:hypothetical protein